MKTGLKSKFDYFPDIYYGIVNRDKTTGQLAKELSVSKTTVSRYVHSDLFALYCAETGKRLDILFDILNMHKKGTYKRKRRKK